MVNGSWIMAQSSWLMAGASTAPLTRPLITINCNFTRTTKERPRANKTTFHLILQDKCQTPNQRHAHDRPDPGHSWCAYFLDIFLIENLLFLLKYALTALLIVIHTFIENVRFPVSKQPHFLNQKTIVLAWLKSCKFL